MRKWEESKIKTTLLLCWELPDRAQSFVLLLLLLLLLLFFPCGGID